MSEEGQDLGRLPRARVVDAVRGHRGVHVEIRVVCGVVEEIERSHDQRRLLAVGERDVERLIERRSVVRRKDIQCAPNPGHAQLRRNGIAVAASMQVSWSNLCAQKHEDIPNAIEVHQVVRVLESKPFFCSEHVAEVGAVSDDVVVSAQLLHAIDVRVREVEVGRDRVEASNEGRGVLAHPCTTLHGAHGSVKRGARDLVSHVWSVYALWEGFVACVHGG